MTDEQIIKALGLCSSEHLGCEDGCPYVEVACLGGDALLKDAFALVKKKDTEIDILIRKNETLKDENFELKAEVERLEHQLETLCLTLKLAKSEAIKEFWEKAKNTREYRTCPYVYISDGNNLVKEMAGESNV